jgi:N-acylglucosamine 2-epimerase
MFHMDWTEAVERTNGLCNYGHVTEAGWFIAKLAAFTGDERHAGLARGLVDWAIEHGFDRDLGGLYDYGRPTGEVVRNFKVWWNQAELLGALAFLYRITGEERYLDTLEKQASFIDGYVLDKEYGEWYPRLNADGTVAETERGRADHKGSRSKSPYHVIQALYHAHNDLGRAAGVRKERQLKPWVDHCL